MRKSLSGLVTDLQRENEDLVFLKKLFTQACRHEFGLDIKSIHRALKLAEIFEKQLAEKQGQQAALPRAVRGAAPGQTEALPMADIGEEGHQESTASSSAF